MTLRIVGAAGLALALLAGAAGAKDRTVAGGTHTFQNATVNSWAVLDGAGRPREVGVTIPMAVVRTPPPSPGPGPAGAVAVLPFPAEVQKDTFLNHFEMHWNPHGHIPPVFMKPHFDFHFYGIPEAEVRAIQTMDPNPPAAEYLPKGYTYPGKDTFEKEMGVHTVDMAVMDESFTACMIAGTSGGRMTFVEPMVTQDYLLGKKDIRLSMPLPAKFGRSTLYPMKFTGKYDKKSDAYRLVFSDFKPVR